MASDLSKYLGNLMCRWLAGEAMPTPPADLELSLWNGDPKGAGTEVTTTIRPAGRIAGAFTPPANDGVTNTMALDSDANFGVADAGVTVTHMAVHDAASAGDILASKSVGTNVIAASDVVKFLAADLVFTIGS